MKRSLFKLTVFVLLISQVATAQTKTIYKKSFPTTKSTSLNLEFTNSAVTIERSSDDQIYIDLSIEFDNYSKEEVQKVLDEIRVDTRTLNERIDFLVFSKTKLSREHYALNSKEGFVLDYDDLGLGGKKKNQYKSKDSILREIRKKSKDRLFNKLKILGENGEKRNIDKKSIQTMKTRFVVKVPKHIYFRINGIDTQVFVEDDLEQRVDINISKGLFKGLKIRNNESSLNVSNANVSVEELAVDRLQLQDVSKGLFGIIEDTECVFKGSRVELGYIGKDVSVRDYNSKIFFYNFDKQFEELIFKGEYTELFVFDFDKNVKLKAKGSITLMFDEGSVVSSSSKEVKPQTTSLEKTTKKTPYGCVEVNLENGVLHVVSDEKQKSK